jgi:hypothetical protein
VHRPYLKHFFRFCLLAPAVGLLQTARAQELIACDIGAPAQVGSLSLVSDGVELTGGGRDIGGNSDQFQFANQERSGDFDIQVQLQSLGPSHPWAKAGLMLRQSLNANSPFAAILATPSLNGVVFQSRGLPGVASGTTGSVPVNYPYTWLRLQRVGGLCTGFAGFDGQTWTRVGTASLSLTEPGGISRPGCDNQRRDRNGRAALGTPGTVQPANRTGHFRNHVPSDAPGGR